MEAQGQRLLGHDGQRSPSPPPPPPPSDDTQPSSHHQEPLEVKEEVGVVNQEPEKGAAAAAAAAAFVGGQSDVAEENEEWGADEEKGAAVAQPEEAPAVLTDHQEPLEIKEQIGVVNQEREQGAAVASSLVGDHGDVAGEHEEEGTDEEEEGAAVAQPEEAPAVLTGHQEPLEINEEIGVVNQEREQGAAAAALVGDHSDVAGEHEEEGADEEEEGAAVAQPEEAPAVLTDDLRDKIVRQVEYYFSDENLPNDKFMLKHVKKDKQGFVPITVVASFRRMKRLVRDLSLIEAALRTSSQLVVSKDGRKVRRLHPLPVVEVKDTVSCTVIVENLPEDYSRDNLQKIFGNVGKILNITIHDPHSTEESKPTRKTEKSLSSKLHARIMYETTEAAANAVATLNDEKNWRSGMRVELLRKRMGKYGLSQRGHKETFSEKNTNDQTSEKVSDGQKLKSDDHHDETAEKEEEEHIAGSKGKRRIRYRSRGWAQQNLTGQGHGQIPCGSSNGVSKPPPGPRMPDGTRGFTMGRGKPAIFEPKQNGV